MIIRKNNYLSGSNASGNGASNERGSSKDHNDLASLNKTSNFNTLLSSSGGVGNGLSNNHAIENSSLIGGSNEISLSQTQTIG